MINLYATICRTLQSRPKEAEEPERRPAAPLPEVPAGAARKAVGAGMHLGSCSLLSGRIHVPSQPNRTKVRDGLFIEFFTARSHHAVLNETYEKQRAALEMILRHVPPLPANYDGLVVRFNDFWKAQGATADILDSSAIADEIGALLQKHLPEIKRSLLASIPAKVDKAVALASGEDRSEIGLKGYLEMGLKGSGLSSRGLNSAVGLLTGEEPGLSVEGMKQYQRRAAGEADSVRERGLKQYQELVTKTGSYSVFGCEDYISMVRSDGSFRQGMGSLERTSAKLEPGAAWLKLKRQYETFVTTIRSIRNDFIAQSQQRYDAFIGAAKKYSDAGESRLHELHAKFEKTVAAAYAPFPGKVGALGDKYASALAAVSAEVSPEFTEVFQAARGMECIVEKLENDLHEEKSSVLNSMYDAQAAFEEKMESELASASPSLEGLYEAYAADIESMYDAAAEKMKREYDAMSEALDSFNGTPGGSSDELRLD